MLFLRQLGEIWVDLVTYFIAVINSQAWITIPVRPQQMAGLYS